MRMKAYCLLLEMNCPRVSHWRRYEYKYVRGANKLPVLPSLDIATAAYDRAMLVCRAE